MHDATLKLEPYFVKLKDVSNPKQIWFCFHYLGGSASVFFPWVKDMPADVVLYSAQLPGRGERSTEPFLRHHQAIVNEFVDVFLQQSLKLPFVFFGHSMGALIAYKTICALEKQRVLPPHCLVVSACKSPALVKTERKTYHLDDQYFIQKLIQYGGTPSFILEDESLLKIFLPRLKADTEVLETFHCSKIIKTHCPIIALGGMADMFVPIKALQDWQLYSYKDFFCEAYPSGHFFIKEFQADIIKAIIERQFLWM